MRIIVELDEGDEIGKRITKALKELTEPKKEEPKKETVEEEEL